jgi:hypothetical protein
VKRKIPIGAPAYDPTKTLARSVSTLNLATCDNLLRSWVADFRAGKCADKMITAQLFVQGEWAGGDAIQVRAVLLDGKRARALIALSRKWAKEYSK